MLMNTRVGRSAKTIGKKRKKRWTNHSGDQDGKLKPALLLITARKPTSSPAAQQVMNSRSRLVPNPNLEENYDMCLEKEGLIR